MARDGRLDLLAEDDFTNAYLVRVNETFRRYVGDSGTKPQNMVAVFQEDGLCPKRAEWRIDLPMLLCPGVGRYVQYAGMALPKSVYMLDLPRPPDGTITVNCGAEQVRLSVPPGNTMVFVRKMSSAAPSVVKLFTLPN